MPPGTSSSGASVGSVGSAARTLAVTPAFAAAALAAAAFAAAAFAAAALAAAALAAAAGAAGDARAGFGDGPAGFDGSAAGFDGGVGCGLGAGFLSIVDSSRTGDGTHGRAGGAWRRSMDESAATRPRPAPTERARK